MIIIIIALIILMMMMMIMTMIVGSLKIKSEDVKEKSQEVKLCHSLTSGGTFDAWSEFGSFRHVEEVASCGTGGSPVGQLGDPLGRIQAAGIYLKSYLGLLPCQ